MRPFDNRHSPDKPILTKQGHLQEFSSRGVHSSPVSLSGSSPDVPLLLVNGAPQLDLHIHSPAPGTELMQTNLAPNSKPFPSHSELQLSFQLEASTFRMYDHTDVFVWLCRYPRPLQWQPALDEIRHGHFKVLVSPTYK